MSSVPTNTWGAQLREVFSSPLGIVVMTCFVGFIAYVHISREHPTYDDEDYKKEGHVRIPAPMKNLSLTEKKLQQYDSQNPDGKYLVALLGTVYDVSCAPHDFGPNGSYEMLAGTDIMWYIRSSARYEAQDFNTYINEWKTMLEDHFYAAGVLVTDKGDVSDSDESTVYDSATGKDEYNEVKVELNANQEMEEQATFFDSSMNASVEEKDNTLVQCSQGDETMLAQ